VVESVVLSWSGGKDSTMALHQCVQVMGLHIASLLTTVTDTYDRVSIHGVRRSLLQAQANALGLPLEEASLPVPATNDIYEAAFASALERIRTRTPSVRRVVFGDLFLADIRQWRIAQMERLGMEAVFPLWGEPTTGLAHRFLQSGFRAWVACVDARSLPEDAAGRRYDEKFLASLPSGVDPCGENGEFHTFVDTGPLFGRPVPVRRGQRVRRGDIVYADLLVDEAADG
jgi:uncharacterized protein (TIGR00290 family)